MNSPHRDNAETLAAENERLKTELETLKAKKSLVLCRWHWVVFACLLSTASVLGIGGIVQLDHHQQPMTIACVVALGFWGVVSLMFAFALVVSQEKNEGLHDPWPVRR